MENLFHEYLARYISGFYWTNGGAEDPPLIPVGVYPNSGGIIINSAHHYMFYDDVFPPKLIEGGGEAG